MKSPSSSPNVLVDTNIIINFFRNTENYKNELLNHRISISTVSIGELYAGAYKSARPQFHKDKIDLLLTVTPSIPIDIEITEIYGEIWAKLSREGNMIPTNDIWIAATAIKHQLPLISNDQHFQRIPNLDHKNW